MTPGEYTICAYALLVVVGVIAVLVSKAIPREENPCPECGQESTNDQAECMQYPKGTCNCCDKCRQRCTDQYWNEYNDEGRF